MTKKVVSFFQEKIGVTPSVAAPGDTHPTDATETLESGHCESAAGKVDAHLLNNAYRRSEWSRLTPLLAAISVILVTLINRKTETITINMLFTKTETTTMLIYETKKI